MNIRKMLALGVVLVSLIAGGGAALAQADEREEAQPSGPAARVPAAEAAAPVSDHRFAVVNGAGELVRGRNAVDANPVGSNPGDSEVIFDRDVRGCAYTATIGSAGAGNAFDGIIDVASRSGNPNAVFVDTRNPSGTSSSRPYHLAVHC